MPGATVPQEAAPDVPASGAGQGSATPVDAAGPTAAIDAEAAATSAGPRPSEGPPAARPKVAISARLSGAATVEPTPAAAEIAPDALRFAMFGKHPSYHDFYWFARLDSDPRLEWFRAVGDRLRAAHPGDRPGTHDRWFLWASGDGVTSVAAAWDSYDSLGRGRRCTPLFACLAAEGVPAVAFARQAAEWLAALQARLFDGTVADEAAFDDAVAASRAGWSSDLSRRGGWPADDDDSSAARDVVRSLGLGDPVDDAALARVAASLFPKVTLATQLRNAGGTLLASLASRAKRGAVSRHRRLDAVDDARPLTVATRLAGWARLRSLVASPDPAGVAIAPDARTDLFLGPPESADVALTYATDDVGGA